MEPCRDLLPIAEVLKELPFSNRNDYEDEAGVHRNAAGFQNQNAVGRMARAGDFTVAALEDIVDGTWQPPLVARVR